MPTSISKIAVRYRRERVAYDQIRMAFNANDDAGIAPHLEASFIHAFGRCQASAEAIRQETPGTDDDRVERVAVLLDAGLMAGLPTAELVAHLQTLEVA